MCRIRVSLLRAMDPVFGRSWFSSFPTIDFSPVKLTNTIRVPRLGWDGYDTDTFNLPGSDSSATGESPFDSPGDQDFYSIPYQDLLDGFQQ